MTLGVFTSPEVVKARRGWDFRPPFAPAHRPLFLLLAATLQCQPGRKEGKCRDKPLWAWGTARQGERALSAAALPWLPAAKLPARPAGSLPWQILQHTLGQKLQRAESCQELSSSPWRNELRQCQHFQALRGKVSCKLLKGELRKTKWQHLSHLLHSRLSAVTVSFTQQIYLTIILMSARNSQKSMPQDSVSDSSQQNLLFSFTWGPRAGFVTVGLLWGAWSHCSGVPGSAGRSEGRRPHSQTPQHGVTVTAWLSLGREGLQKTFCLSSAYTQMGNCLQGSRRQEGQRIIAGWSGDWLQAAPSQFPASQAVLRKKPRGRCCLGSLPPHRTVLLHHKPPSPVEVSAGPAINSKFSQETALQLAPKLTSSQRGLEKSLTFG